MGVVLGAAAVLPIRGSVCNDLEPGRCVAT